MKSDRIRNIAKNFKVKFCSKKNELPPVDYSPLSPTDNANSVEMYTEALSWALSLKSKIRNIALSGPYGSGKSSILQTFIKENKGKYRFLNISLATFKSDESPDKHSSEGGVSKTNPKDEKLQRLIELSILQQIIYREKGNKTPESQFKKTLKRNIALTITNFIVLLLFLFSLLHLFVPSVLKNIQLFAFLERLEMPWTYVLSLTFCITFIVLAYNLFAFVMGSYVKKVKLASTEIELDKGVSKSILNKHIDEIIYFFEETKYDVVIIEDLDRFDQSDIFTKLREINLLINSSERITQSVVFVYAIKDDMFLDKERVKFFDFMIPIVPIINFSTSGEILRKKEIIKTAKISEDLIDNLSIFIDDMRLLHNIINEFIIYNKIANNELIKNNLLAIVIYKNLYPNDFAKLGCNDGLLYSVISQKSKYIADAKKEIDAKITDLKDSIQNSEEQMIDNVTELRILYITKAIETTESFITFLTNNKAIEISKIANSDELFSLFKESKLKYQYHRTYYNDLHSSVFKVDFKNVERMINPKLSYNEREKRILNKPNINDLKKQIEELINAKARLQRKSLREFVSSDDIILNSNKDKQDQLIHILLRNGYIDENYLDYISVFHEGALTKADYTFLVNVKMETTTDYNYILSKPVELLKKINTYAFESKYVFNQLLIDELIVNNEYKERRKVLFAQLANEKDDTITFIRYMYDNSKHQDKFINELCDNWHNIWRYISTSEVFDDEQRSSYFDSIIRYANINDILCIFSENDPAICQCGRFLNIDTTQSKLKDIISELNIIFENLNTNSKKDLFSLIRENGYYAININMLKLMMSDLEGYNKHKFGSQNYTHIYELGNNDIISYIEDNIDMYVESVYLNLEYDNEEAQDRITALVNNDKLSLDTKIMIIERTQTVIDKIADIKDLEICDLLYDKSKVSATWDNILNVFTRSGSTLSKSVIDFMNTSSNTEILSSQRMTTDENEDGNAIYSELCRAIIYESKLSTGAYSLLQNSIPWVYSSLETERINADRVKILIENNTINITVRALHYLRDNFTPLNIMHLEKHFNKYKGLINDIVLNANDIKLVLESKEIDIESKFKFIELCDEGMIVNSKSNITLVLSLLKTNPDYPVSSDLKREIALSRYIPQDDKIDMFNNNVTLFTTDNIDNLMETLGGNYAVIADKKSRPIFNDTSRHRDFLYNLKQRGYINSYREDKKGLRVYHKQ